MQVRIRVERKLKCDGCGIDPCDVTRNQAEKLDYSEQLKTLNNKIDYLAAAEYGFRNIGRLSRGQAA
jgi:hypothetical protein